MTEQLPNPAELVAEAFPKRRSRLIVQIDLDPVPGWGHAADDHRALVQGLLDEAVPHYNPSVKVSIVSPGVES